MDRAIMPTEKGRLSRNRAYGLALAILLGVLSACAVWAISANTQAQAAARPIEPERVALPGFNAGPVHGSMPGAPAAISTTPARSAAPGLPTATPVSCAIQFTDVPQGSPFYPFVRCIACRGIVGGYNTSPPCTTGTPCFLPGAAVSRGQMAKYISNGAAYTDNIPPNQQTFTDVPPSHPLWIYIERIYTHGIVGGYNTSPPCTTGTPCFLPGAAVSRGQTAKFVSKAAGYTDNIPPNQQTFTDVPHSNAFWIYVERVKLHGIIVGYNISPPCTTGTPCFIPGQRVSRGQAAQFISNAFFRDCQTP